MFSGIIEGTCAVESVSKNKLLHSLTVRFAEKPQSLKIGESIAINGVCLTVTAIKENRISFDIMEESFKNTTLKDLRSGDIVNFERSLKWQDRLDGHFVLGHVDKTGKILSIEKDKKAHIDVSILPEDKIYITKKGSIAIDGISLTVSDGYENYFRACLIPYTLEHTNLKHKRPNDYVNIEFDILGKYAAGGLSREKKESSKLTEEFLKESGFI